jgi:copper chaperone NosL
VAGLVDFYRWGYAYGHELDEHAAIKVPGMSYQPPVIGTKQLLNFHAASWPDVGAWIVALCLAVGVTVAILEWRRGQRGSLLEVSAAGHATALA